MNQLESILEAADFMMQAEGNGMPPYVVDGDIVLCSADKSQNGEFVVVSVDGGPAELYRMSEHPNITLLFRTGYPDPGLYFHPDELDRLRVLGRVLGVVRAFPCFQSSVDNDTTPAADALSTTERSVCNERARV
ncbi:MAG: LexA family protein [Faecalibacterium sp.]